MGTVPVPPVFTAGSKLTAASLNQLSGCLNFLRLTPRCYVYQTAATTLTTGVYGLLGFDTEVFDVANQYDGVTPTGTLIDAPMHDTVTNNSRIYARTTGKYEVSGQVQFAFNATGQRRCQVRLNSGGSSTGGTGLGEFIDDASTTTETALVIPHFELPLNAGDYLEVFARQASGGNLNTNTGLQGYTFLLVKFTGA